MMQNRVAVANGAGKNRSKDISVHYVEKKARIFAPRVSRDHQWKVSGFLFIYFNLDVQEAIPKKRHLNHHYSEVMVDSCILISSFNTAINIKHASVGAGSRIEGHSCGISVPASLTALSPLIIVTARLYQNFLMCSLACFRDKERRRKKKKRLTNRIGQAANCKCYLHTCLAAKRSHTHKGGQTERWKVRSGQIVPGRGVKKERKKKKQRGTLARGQTKSQPRTWKRAVRAGSGHKRDSGWPTRNNHAEQSICHVYRSCKVNTSNPEYR